MNIGRVRYDGSDAWREELSDNSAVVITAVPLDADNHNLRSIGQRLGEASTRALPLREGAVEPGAVVRVEALKSTPLDQFGKALRSSSALPFALHTDESFCAIPARWVLLHCWRPDSEGGGESLLAKADPLSRAMWANADSNLKLPYAIGDRPVIGDCPRLRFNPAEIAGECMARARAMTPAEVLLKRHLEEILIAHAVRFRLGSGDLLIVDNHRVAHGRTAFHPASGRLLKRLRIL